MAAAGIQFALSPAQASKATLIDYTTSEGAKLFRANTTALSNKFDGDVKNLRVFLANTARHSSAAGWDNITSITKDNTTRDLFTEYGLIEMDMVKDLAKIYIAAEDRDAQDAYQMAIFLFGSLTPEFKAKIITKKDEYTDTDRHDGPCLLKLIITEVVVQTRSTSSHIRQSLMELDKYMVDVAKSDIAAFNRYVQDCRNDLASYGETSTDLLLYLFRAYQASSDAEFNRYIKDKHNTYNEGTDMTVTELMTNTETKYKTLLQANAWCQPSPEQAQIIALQSTITKLTAAAKKYTKTGEPKKQRGDQYVSAWKYENPKKAATKQSGDKTYYWCTNHKGGMWVLHKPEDCRASRRSNNTKAADKDKKDTIAAAATADTEHSDSEQDDKEGTEEETAPDGNNLARVLGAILQDIGDDGHQE